jgi:phosphate acyltransferase
MKIGIDVMGGDYAPEAVVLGAILAYDQLQSDTELVLIGNEKNIKEISKKHGFEVSNFRIVHTDVLIEMGEHPAKAYAQKTNSSINLGYKMLRDNQIDGFASAGNTGAMLVGAMYTAKSIPGVIRPSIAATIPNLSDVPVILLDVGINPDAKPDVLYQYAILGSLYAFHVFGVENPKVGLLNIGSEEEKGNLLTKATYQAMKGTAEFNFIGNVEGNDIFDSDKVNVIVTDGFVGNVMLKEAEAFYSLLKKKNVGNSFFEKFNFENYGGTPILGINYPAVIGHGISNEKAIKNMILHTIEVVNVKLVDRIKEAFK